MLIVVNTMHNKMILGDFGFKLLVILKERKIFNWKIRQKSKNYFLF